LEYIGVGGHITRRPIGRRKAAPLNSNIERMKRVAHHPSPQAAIGRGPAPLAFAVVTVLTACASTNETKQDDKIYQAYGDTWVYSKTEISTRYLALDSPHGILGPRYRDEERHLIRNSAGKTISIPDNLYALQKDGTLRKIECCQYFREKGEL
jgi:hypothetical protein